MMVFFANNAFKILIRLEAGHFKNEKINPTTFAERGWSSGLYSEKATHSREAE